MNKFRDIILVLVAIGLLLAILLPNSTDKQKNNDDNDSKVTTDTKVPNLAEPNAAAKKHNLLPVDGVPHPYFPIIKGSTWHYLVSGPKKLIDDDWTFTILEFSQETGKGLAEMGFGKNRNKTTIKLVNNELTISKLPFSYPLQYPLGEEIETTSKLLPAVSQILLGNTYDNKVSKIVKYRTRDKKHNIIDLDANLIQIDKISIGETSKVIVPAGIFNGVLFSTASRASMETIENKRQILDTFTGGSFKTEKTWFVKGVGIVKRIVEYSSSKEDIVFTLMDFSHGSN